MDENSSPWAIDVKGLRKDYAQGATSTRVLRDVDLQIARGECLFLVGPSGSGKTTLLSILGCVLSATTGSVTILGHDVTHLSPREQARFRRERIGFVFQRFHLFAALTARDNVCVPLQLLGWSRASARQRADELLAAVGLHDKRSSRVPQLSMGQRQRVAVARALAGDPDIVLADEPTASLDEAAGLQAMGLLKDLCHQLGKTIVVVTHDPRIEPLADRILELRNGQIAAERSRAAAAPREGTTRHDWQQGEAGCGP